MINNVAQRVHPNERGVVGGLEVLPFGLLIFICMSLVLSNAWAVVDAKLAVEDAAREAGRAYVEAHDAASAPAAASAAARTSMAGSGRDPLRLQLSDNSPMYERCAVVEHTTAYRVAAVKIPFAGSFGSGITVHGHHREILDPFASGMGRRNACDF